MKKGKDIITVTGVTPEHIDIKDMVYTIRGRQVMLDFHIAGLYHVETMAAAQTAQKEINALGFNYEIPLLSVNLTCTYALKELGLWSGFKKMNNLTEKLYESN